MTFDHRIFIIQQHGGISRYFAKLVDHLPEFDVDARVISPIYFTNNLQKLPSSKVIGRHLSWSPRKVRLSRMLGPALHAPIARLTGTDIVHETYFGMRRLAPKKCRVVTTIYDMIFEMNPDIAEARATIAEKRAAIARADHLFCISESTRRDLLRFYPEVENKTSVTLLGFDAEFQLGDRGTSLHGRPYILFVGIRRDYKNFAGLLSAYRSSARLLRDFDLVCVGHHQLNPEEIALISAFGLTDKVFIRQAPDDDTLRAWYQHAAVFAYPSLYEGFGIPPLEAMAANCPVVCMKISSMPEVCGDAAEYAYPDAPESLGVALANVLYGEGRRGELIAKGAERVRNFSWRKCAQQTSDVYKALM